MTAEKPERCDIQIESGRAIRLVPGPNADQLNEKQLVDYREHRHEFIGWLRTKGKNPEKREGYSPYSVYGTAYRCARFDRWVWSREDRYTTPPAPRHGDEYMDEHVAYRDVTTATKGKTEESLMRYFRWVSKTTHTPEWDREQRFRSGGSIPIPRRDAGVQALLDRLEADRNRVKETDIEALEAEIDEAVYDLFDLDEEEREVVEDYLDVF